MKKKKGFEEYMQIIIDVYKALCTILYLILLFSNAPTNSKILGVCAWFFIMSLKTK